MNLLLLWVWESSQYQIALPSLACNPKATESHQSQDLSFPSQDKVSPIFDPFNPPVLYMGQRWWPLLSGKWSCPWLIPPLKLSDLTLLGQFIVPWTIYIAKTLVPSWSVCPIISYSSWREVNQNMNDRPQNICCWEICVWQILLC